MHILRNTRHLWCHCFLVTVITRRVYYLFLVLITVNMRVLEETEASKRGYRSSLHLYLEKDINPTALFCKCVSMFWAVLDKNVTSHWNVSCCWLLVFCWPLLILCCLCVFCLLLVRDGRDCEWDNCCWSVMGRCTGFTVHGFRGTWCSKEFTAGNYEVSLNIKKYQFICSLVANTVVLMLCWKVV